jgi:hypothetical protein
MGIAMVANTCDNSFVDSCAESGRGVFEYHLLPLIALQRHYFYFLFSHIIEALYSCSFVSLLWSGD